MTSEGKKAEAPLIFVVDDEPMLLELGKAILQPRGFEVQTYRDPESTLEVYHTLKEFPDLILTDYAMHAMTGMDLIRESRKLNPKQKIILISGTVDENIFRHAAEKPDRFVAKPYDPEKLIALIREVIAE
jgi:two-component system cell cycle sensor histidine kinase/response regulator CckA